MADVFDRLRDALADRYSIEQELGSGGMATVYLAKDLRHERQVAVKVLRPELAATLGPDRFLQEVRIAANLTHPHILPLHDSGEADGFLYYVMPFVEGESLRERLAKEGELPIAEAVRILREISDALAYSHEHGVVHRDIKPDNIMLSGRHALVTDFGVAKAVSEATGRQKLTTEGIALGTPAYMAPEQAAADPHIDHRADIYAVGAVAYELLTGRPPFTGTTQQEVLAAHVTQAPESVTKYRESVPPALEHLVLKCLAKKAADRWQTAEELLPQLEALSTPSGGVTPTGTIPVTSASKSGSRRMLGVVGVAALVVVAVGGFLLLRPSSEEGRPLDPNAVAVMPFRISGTARRDTAIADLREGMLDLLDATLTGDVGLRSIDPRSVLVAWRSRTDDGTEDLPLEQMLPIAAGLGAGRILVGGIVGARERLTINATLHDVTGLDDPIEVTITGLYDSLPHLIDRLAAQVMSLALGEEPASLPHLSEAPLVAVEAYLAGRRALRRGQGLESVGYFDRALELDSTFALAALGLGFAGAVAGNTNTDAGVRGAQRAWVLRDRLSERDRAWLAAYMGRNYPAPRTGRQVLQDWQPAVELAGDRAIVWAGYANALRTWGEFLDEPDWRQRANVALDRAWALDSTETWSTMMQVTAIDRSDTMRARRAQRALLGFEPSPWQVFGRWRVALVLGDSAELETTRPLLGNAQRTTTQVGYTTVYGGYPLDDWEKAIADFSLNAATQREHLQVMEQRRKLARIRGRIREATFLSDSLATLWPQFAGASRRQLIFQALHGDGGDSTAAATIEEMRAQPREGNIGDLVYPELWKITHGGDTSDTRAVIRRAREIAEATQSITALPSLLEAVLEGLDRDRDEYPAASRLDSLLGEGVSSLMGEGASAIAGTYLLARMYASRGEHERALHVVRRRLQTNSSGWHESWPAFLREEGRLAALTGDTEGAIEAYARYLELRTDPDPGFMQDQVDEVRAELARLTGERGGRD